MISIVQTRAADILPTAEESFELRRRPAFGAAPLLGGAGCMNEAWALFRCCCWTACLCCWWGADEDDDADDADADVAELSQLVAAEPEVRARSITCMRVSTLIDLKVSSMDTWHL